MYNRYIPQSDGSFRRSRVAEQTVNSNSPPPIRQEQEPVAPEKPIATTEPIIHQIPQPNPNSQKRVYHNDSSSVSSFLKGLLPSNFDTEDLLIIMLLLLMSGNNSKDQNAALLTLGIYLFI